MFLKSLRLDSLSRLLSQAYQPGSPTRRVDRPRKGRKKQCGVRLDFESRG